MIAEVINSGGTYLNFLTDDTDILGTVADKWLIGHKPPNGAIVNVLVKGADIMDVPTILCEYENTQFLIGEYGVKYLDSDFICIL